MSIAPPVLVVVNQNSEWPFNLPGVEVVSSKTYLSDARYNELKGARLFNLCRTHRYQSLAYYVSLLAAARGHKHLPSVSTIQDMKSSSMVRFASEELADLMNKSLASQNGEKFILDIYFGKVPVPALERLATGLFKLFQAPLLRVNFNKNTQKKWYLQTITTISINEIPKESYEFVSTAALEFFSGKRSSTPKKNASPRFNLAILTNSEEPNPPSDAKSLQKFIRAAEQLGIETEIIEKEDFSRVAEFDGLFIRETTSVNHHTYKFSRRAAAEGLVVIDDPNSILKCTNKVYLAELLDRNEIPAPKTIIIHKENIQDCVQKLGFPLILKQPDSAFSLGVKKMNDQQELEVESKRLFEKSELLIAQEFIPTHFDWRVGIFDRQPLYVCRYYMARNHWQVIKPSHQGRSQSGKSDTLSVEHAPPAVVKLALKAANLIGDGLYGVDIKQVGEKLFVIEVNDNPSIDSGVEDLVLKDELYSRIMRIFARRMEMSKEGYWRK